MARGRSQTWNTIVSFEKIRIGLAEIITCMTSMVFLKRTMQVDELMRLVDLLRLGWPRDIVYSFFDHGLCFAFQLLYDLKGVSTVKGGCKLIRLVDPGYRVLSSRTWGEREKTCWVLDATLICAFLLLEHVQI
jgi:hypothetical protein